MLNKVSELNNWIIGNAPIFECICIDSKRYASGDLCASVDIDCGLIYECFTVEEHTIMNTV